MQVLLSGQMRQQCQLLQASLLQEDGVATAVDCITQQIKLARIPETDTSLLMQAAAQDQDAHKPVDFESQDQVRPVL